jgi:hypothetical protein
MEPNSRLEKQIVFWIFIKWQRKQLFQKVIARLEPIHVTDKIIQLALRFQTCQPSYLIDNRINLYIDDVTAVCSKKQGTEIFLSPIDYETAKLRENSGHGLGVRLFQHQHHVTHFDNMWITVILLVCLCHSHV